MRSSADLCVPWWTVVAPAVTVQTIGHKLALFVGGLPLLDIHIKGQVPMISRSPPLQACEQLTPQRQLLAAAAAVLFFVYSICTGRHPNEKNCILTMGIGLVFWEESSSVDILTMPQHIHCLHTLNILIVSSGSSFFKTYQSRFLPVKRNTFAANLCFYRRRLHFNGSLHI